MAKPPKKLPLTKLTEPIGIHFGRRDVDRTGLFIEMEYLRYDKPAPPVTSKGRQMIPGGPKSKQEGYFRHPFVRVFEKEAYTDMKKLLLKQENESAKKNLSTRAFLPGGNVKFHATPGDYFGCFGPKLPAFSPKLVPKKPYVKEPANMLSRPGKWGGPGYCDITIGKYPPHPAKDFYDEIKVSKRKTYTEHMSKVRAGPLLSAHCPQPYFDRNPYLTDKPVPQYRIPPPAKPITFGAGRFLPPSPAKWGTIAGCIGKFPPYPTKSTYKTKAELRGKGPAPPEGKIFYPPIRVKPVATPSVVNHNLAFVINSKNWETLTPVIYPITMIEA